MTTATKTRQRVKPQRGARILQPILDGIAVIEIHVGKVRHTYEVRPMQADFGTAFRIHKMELVQKEAGVYELESTARYDVCLNEQQSTCECKGFLRHAHCKHLDGLTVLRQRGSI